MRFEVRFTTHSVTANIETADDFKSNEMSSPSTSPSAQEIWKWTFTKEANAPCFIRDALAMKESNTRDADFYWLGHIPCRTVIIVGIVVGIQDYEKRTMYTIDDSTAVIDCVLRHRLPPKAPTNADASRSVQKSKWEATSPIPPPPPPTPVTAIGYPVQVIGKVVLFYDTRQIVAESIEPCQSTNDQWKHWKTVVELHKSRYSVAKPFEIPAPLAVSSCETGSDGNSHEKLPAAASNIASSSKRQTCALASGAGIRVPRTPLKRPLHDHAPSSPITDSTTSAPSSPIKHGSTMTDLFSTPTKRPRIPLDQTPKARTVSTTHDMTPRASALKDSAPRRPAFTLSHLRRVPELALLACRVVYTETKRRARAERDAEREKAVQTHKTSSNIPYMPRVKMKRLFSWAVLKLYEEGSIVLWDKPLMPVPVSGLRPPGSGDTSGLWKTPNDTASCSSVNNSVFSTANSTMFSSTGASSSKFVMSEEDAYLSDPPMYEEDEAYVSVTPTLLAAPVREIMRAKGIRGKSAKVGAEEVTRCLRREDARWARIGAWAVEETMDMILGE
ncbi:uncharacterized protein BJ212DRAFT_1324897, partial [Suillus subaureus]